MKEVAAFLLRRLGVWQNLAVATLCSAAGIVFYLTARPSTRSTWGPFIVFVLGTGGAALVMSFVRRGQQIEASQGDEGPGWTRLLLAVVGIALTTTFLSYSLGVYRRKIYAACNAGPIYDHYDERLARIRRARDMQSNPLAWIPLLLSDRAPRSCDAVEKDLRRLDRGRCPQAAIVDRPCTCGGRAFKDVVSPHCEAPTCLYRADGAEHFHCRGEPVPEGFDNTLLTAPSRIEEVLAMP